MLKTNDDDGNGEKTGDVATSEAGDEFLRFVTRTVNGILVVMSALVAVTAYFIWRRFYG